jgi:hypothetical protein
MRPKKSAKILTKEKNVYLIQKLARFSHLHKIFTPRKNTTKSIWQPQSRTTHHRAESPLTHPNPERN